MTSQDTSAHEMLKQAHQMIACLVHMAGGKVDIPRELMVRALEREPVVQMDVWPGGAVTLTEESGVTWPDVP